MKSGVNILAVEANLSLPARGVWIEILKQKNRYGVCLSLPARGVWIEILTHCPVSCAIGVTPRKGSVD